MAFIGWRIVWPLTQRINPYYAAVQVEHAVPGDKNSVVNWLDLKDEKLPWTIRAAVGQKAAKDLSQAPWKKPSAAGTYSGWSAARRCWSACCWDS